MKHVQVRLTEENWRRYKRLAIEEGCTLQKYIELALELRAIHTENTLEDSTYNDNDKENDHG